MVKDALFSAILVAANEALLKITALVGASSGEYALIASWIARGHRGLNGLWDPELGLSLDHDLRARRPLRAHRGVICWLPDLQSWAKGIAAGLEPGGRFVLVDFHPAAGMLDADWNHARTYPAGGEPLRLEEGVEDYVGESRSGLSPAGFSEGVQGFEYPATCHLFRWGLGETVTALAASGLRISVLEKYHYANGERHFSGMRELPERRMVPPEGVADVPLMYGVRAERTKG